MNALFHEILLSYPSVIQILGFILCAFETEKTAFLLQITDIPYNQKYLFESAIRQTPNVEKKTNFH